MSSSPGRIIYICDCEAHAAPVCEVLREHLHYTVECVPDAQMANLATPGTLLIVDLPGEKMEQAIRALRLRHAEALILAFISFADEAAERGCLAEGADDMLAKPLSTARLELSIRNLLKINRLQQEVARLQMA